MTTATSGFSPKRQDKKDEHRRQRSLKILKTSLAEYAGLFGALVLLVLFFSFKVGNFATGATALAIVNQIPAQLIVAVGVTFVLAVAEIDLSVGSVVGLGGAVLGILVIQHHWPVPAAIAACAGVGLVCGLFNAYVTTLFKLPSFIVTLGALEIARGGSYWVSHSQTQYIGSPIESISGVSVKGVSLAFLFAFGMVVLGQVVLTRTVFGRYVLATGANSEAVRFSGIDVAKVKRAVFIIAGLLASLAAIIDTSRFQSADPNAGTGLELQAIAAVVIGGTSLSGGKGSVIGSFIGVLIIAVLGAGLAAMGVEDEVKRVVTGCVIVVAVILDRYRRLPKTA